MEIDRQAIVTLMDRFMDAWNRHDAKAFAVVFAEDADFTNWWGTGASGRSNIEDFADQCLCQRHQTASTEPLYAAASDQ